MPSINRVEFGGTVLIDLTKDTVTKDKMYKGTTAHASDGTVITGTAEITYNNGVLIMPTGLCTPIS